MLSSDEHIVLFLVDGWDVSQLNVFGKWLVLFQELVERSVCGRDTDVRCSTCP